MIATITEEIENDEQVVPEFIDHPIPEFSDLIIDVSVTPIGSTPDRRDWQTLKQTQRKAANLENIIKTLSSPVKKMCEALLNDLRSLHDSQKYGVFHARLHTLFGEQLEEENFLRWLASKLNIRQS